MQIRNVAIIAHVDHGKTTLVDAFLRQSGIFRVNQKIDDRILDSNALEKERGITILAKNVSVQFGDVKINIVDTPGHADFGGEVERILSMVDGALLVVDAVEGPMPQTRFVLHKALQRGLAPIVVVNKCDRPAADPNRVVDDVFDLFVALDATEKQLDFPVFYASALTGSASADWQDFQVGVAQGGNILPLLQGVVDYVPEPTIQADDHLQMMISNLEYNDYVGRIALGRIASGVLKSGQDVVLSHSERTKTRKGKISQVYTYQGLEMLPVDQMIAGDIAAFSGIEGVEIGETVNNVDQIRPLPAISVDQPTLTMVFRVNDGPLAGQDAQYLTSRQLRDRLWRESRINVALEVSDTESPDQFRVSGRGELHLSVLIETMRREGYSFCVTKPEPVLRQTDTGVLEPYERLHMDVPQEYFGSVMEFIGQRKGELQALNQGGEGRMRAEFLVPARGLIGFASQFLTETRGHGIMHHAFAHYAPWSGAITQRQTGSLVAWEAGSATAYALQTAEERGTLFIGPGTEVYAGMIVGEHSRSGDLDINVAKKKQQTNVRAAGSDDMVKLNTPRQLSLEQYLAYLAWDDCLEVTPSALRLRKLLLDRHAREKQKKHT
ncbi:MAG: translational GTPase TypA [Limnochordia bacterium]|jgi:GTP-binding protein|nr:translational GTPase TypA [Limnochordia bacterium]